jgi:RarD protein
MSTPTDRRGLWIAVASFVLWGLMPLYWHLLNTVPSLQIVAHRIVWSTLLVTAWLCWKFGRHWLRDILREPRKAAMLALSGVLIAFNWGLYIWAVNAGHVIETSLGYFIGPLVSVMLGVLFLGERLRAVQWVAIALAFAGVLWLTFQYGRPPLIALGLAVSFAVYGLVRKLVAVEAVTGLGVENVYLFAPALALYRRLGLGHRCAAGDRRRAHRAAADRLRLRGATSVADRDRPAAVRRADLAVPDRRADPARAVQCRARDRVRDHLDRPGGVRQRGVVAVAADGGGCADGLSFSRTSPRASP